MSSLKKATFGFEFAISDEVIFLYLSGSSVGILIESGGKKMSDVITQSRFKMVVAVHLLLINKNKVLLSRRFNTGYEDGKYSVPAGHVDEGETVSSAMIREAKEEIGISIAPADLEFVHVMHRRSEAIRIDFFFTCKKWVGNPKIIESDKCDELIWVMRSELPDNTIPYVKTAIQCAQQQLLFSEFGWR